MAVIPAFNEAEHIGHVIRSVKPFVDKVVVVDNNSTDITSLVAEVNGALVVFELEQGAGAATRRGWSVAQAMGCDVLVTVDGDGQHEASDIPRLIEPILKNEADVVLGTRFKSPNKIPAYRKFGIWVITVCFELAMFIPISDAQCGIRAFGKKAINDMVITENGYGLMIEGIVKAWQLGCRITEVPVTCYYRGLDKDSNMNPVKQGLKTLWYILKWRLAVGLAS